MYHMFKFYWSYIILEELANDKMCTVYQKEVLELITPPCLYQ